MHEVSLVDALFDEVDRAIGRHPPSSVREVVVRIGEGAGVEVALFRTAFEGLRDARGYGAAALSIEEVPERWRCLDCGRALATGDVLGCDACGGDVTMDAGGELLLARVELEVRDV